MRILIFNQNLFYFEDVSELVKLSVNFLMINSNMIETNIFSMFSPYSISRKKTNTFKKISSDCNLYLNVLFEVAIDCYKTNVLDKIFSRGNRHNEPFSYKRK